MRMLLPLLLFLTACAHHPAAVVQTPSPVQSPKPKGWANQQEYDEASAAQKETDPTKRLALLETWTKDFPTTDYLDERRDRYLRTYLELKMPRETFDTALEILKTRPANLVAAADVLQAVMQLQPAPSPADWDAAAKVAERMVFDTDEFLSFANQPANVTNEAWRSTKKQLPLYAETVLVAIYNARDDPKSKVDDLTKLIQHDPMLPAASYQLGAALLKVIAATNQPERQPLAFWQFARAASYDGPNALPADQRQIPLNYLNKAYPLFHGSTDGLDDLLKLAKYSPFPPANFQIDPAVEPRVEPASFSNK